MLVVHYLHTVCIVFKFNQRGCFILLVSYMYHSTRKLPSPRWWPAAVASCATFAESAVRTRKPCSTTSATFWRTAVSGWVSTSLCVAVDIWYIHAFWVIWVQVDSFRSVSLHLAEIRINIHLEGPLVIGCQFSHLWCTNIHITGTNCSNVFNTKIEIS